MFTKSTRTKTVFSYAALSLIMLLVNSNSAQAAYLVLSASGKPAGGIAPQMQVYVNGTKTGGIISVDSTLKNLFVELPTVKGNYIKGELAIDIAYINDGIVGTENRSLTIKSISIAEVTTKNKDGLLITLPTMTIPTNSIRYDRGFGIAAFDDKNVIPFTQSSPNIYSNGALRFKISTGLTSGQMGLVINDDDPYSVEIGEYYRVKRSIPITNIIHIKMPVKAVLTASEFSAIKTQIDAQLPKYVQAMALAWKQPYAVECNSITSAITFGFKSEQCINLTRLLPLSNPYYLSSSKLPFSDLGMRPSMLLAAYDTTQAKSLINRGFSSNKTYPSGTAYLMQTSDAVRSLRTPAFNDLQLGKFISPSVNVTKVSANYIQKPDILFYFQGLAKVPNIAGSNIYLPGAVADNLTSFGGVLDGSKPQTVILDFIKAGATGSFGTVSEPAAYSVKFPNPQVVIKKYAAGETLIESYWKSVQQPYQGLFVGDPLANPWETILPTPDKTPPTVPSGLLAGSPTDKSASFSWKASVDNRSLDGTLKYKIYRNGALIKDGETTTFFNDTTLTPLTTYNYTVAAYDEAGNVSAQSTPVSVTTLGIPKDPPIGDTTPITGGGSTL